MTDEQFEKMHEHEEPIWRPAEPKRRTRAGEAMREYEARQVYGKSIMGQMQQEHDEAFRLLRDAEKAQQPLIRTFTTGATRNLDQDKLDYEGFLSPAVLKRFAEYMHKNRVQADGSLRSSDNWQKGIPRDAYVKSMWRHFHEVWEQHRNDVSGRDVDSVALEEALCALLFNVQGYLFEVLQGRHP